MACVVCRGQGNCVDGFILDMNERRAVPCPRREVKLNIADIPANQMVVPDAYQELVFSSDDIEKQLYSQPPDLRMEFMDNIMYLYNRATRGERLTRSMLLHTPPNVQIDDISLVYSILKYGIAAGLTASPYYDTYEFDLFHKHFTYNSSANSRFTVAYDDFISRDYCFLKLKAGVITDRDIQLMMMLVDQRARMGLATVVLSPFNLNYLKQAEPYIESIITRDTTINYSKLLYLDLKQV